MAEPGAERKAQAVPAPRAPRLNWELEPWRASFARNLRDSIGRLPAQPQLSSRPGTFWPDVFVPTHVPWRAIGLSGTYHALLLAILLLFVPWFMSLQPKVARVTPSERHTITYYDVSEYLPAINSGSPPAKKTRKADPVLASQPIVSLPPTPDNFRQTIINPQAPHIIQRDVALPNIVVWTTPAPMPVAATERSISSISLPSPNLEVLRPTAAVVNRGVADARSNSLPTPAVVEPTVAADAVKLPVGELNVATPTDVEVPLLPMPAQRAALLGEAEPGVVPPAPSTQALGAGSGSAAKAMGQLIALSTTPVAPSGPITVPVGSRQGQFAAGPEGRPEATGTPAMTGGADGAGGGGEGAGGPGNAGVSGPAGIYVGGPRSNGGAVSGATVAALPPMAGAGPRSSPTREQLLAAARPRVTDPVRETRPSVSSGPGTSNADPRTVREVEDSIFREKRFYQMTLNMPNLTSSGGSWIVRFAELNETHAAGELSAPVAVNKVDPAYPAAMRRMHIEGVVMLYAVIRSDGSVAEVRVLRGIDGALDESARKALAAWKFRPGRKNGEAVDLEAVVSIPFKLGQAF